MIQQSYTSDDGLAGNTSIINKIEESKISKHETAMKKNMKFRDRQDEDSDTDNEERFLFSSSMIVGSNFIELVASDTDAIPDVVTMGPDEMRGDIADYIGYFGLKNVTERTIVAYHLYSSFQINGKQKYKIEPRQGFIKPGDILGVTVSRHFNGQDEMNRFEDIEDLVFLKALPLNENQVSEHNLQNFIDSIDNDIFNESNVDLMFNLEVLTTRFTYEPVLKPNYEELGERVMTPKAEVNQYNLVKDEKLLNSAHSSNTKTKNRATKAESSSQVGDISEQADADEESKHMNSENKGSPQSSIHQLFDDSERPPVIPRQNSFIDETQPKSQQIPKRQDKVKEYGTIEEEEKKQAFPNNDNPTYTQHVTAAAQMGKLVENEYDESEQLENRATPSNVSNINAKNTGYGGFATKQKDIMGLEGDLAVTKDQYNEKSKSPFDTNENDNTTIPPLSLKNEKSAINPRPERLENANFEGHDPFGNMNGQHINRQGTVYDNDHYDEMEEQLNQVDVKLTKENEEDSKFEAAMRSESMHIKLNQFDESSKKVHEKLYGLDKVVEEVHEPDENIDKIIEENSQNISPFDDGLDDY